MLSEVLFIPCPVGMGFPLQRVISSSSYIQHIEFLTVPWRKRKKKIEKPLERNFWALTQNSTYSTGSIFTTLLFQSKQFAFLLTGRCEVVELWSCANPIALPGATLFALFFPSSLLPGAFIFCQRSVVFEWLSNICARCRSEKAGEPGVIKSSCGIKHGWLELVIEFGRWYLVRLVF